VLAIFGQDHKGYFVDVGGYDGITDSNTFLLEKRHGWKGLIIEPDDNVFSKLKRNRDVTLRNVAALGQGAKERPFLSGGELGGLVDFLQDDVHSETRAGLLEDGRVTTVITCGLGELLVEAKAPYDIEYLDLDTEGSEFAILSGVDFKRWHFGLVTVEHAGVVDKREAIFELMVAAGYERVEAWFEDWYFHVDTVGRLLLVDPPEARRIILRATEMAPVVKVKRLISEGKQLLDKGCLEDAVELLYEACSPEYPNNAYAYSLAGTAFKGLGNHEGLVGLIVLAEKNHGQGSALVERLCRLVQ
jgi:FkbM family methyltransferase